jgi:hypothetical protein
MTLKEQLFPHLQQLHRTGTMQLPPDLADAVAREYEKRKGRRLPPCTTCLTDFIKEICRE